MPHRNSGSSGDPSPSGCVPSILCAQRPTIVFVVPHPFVELSVLEALDEFTELLDVFVTFPVVDTSAT